LEKENGEYRALGEIHGQNPHLDDLSDYKFAGYSDAGSQFGRLNFNNLARKKQNKVFEEEGGVCLLSDLQSDLSRSSLYRPQFNSNLRASSHNTRNAANSLKFGHKSEVDVSLNKSSNLE